MKALFALRRMGAIAVAAAAAVAPFAAHAISDFDTQAAGTSLSATADLDIEVNIGRFLYLAVGTTSTDANITYPLNGATAGGAKGKVTFTVNPQDVGDSTTPTTVVGNNDIYYRVLGNTGDVVLSAGGTVPTHTAVPAQTIAWSKFTFSTQSGTIAHPVIGQTLVANGARSLGATTGVVNQTGAWRMTYANDTVIAAGQYTTALTYTATAP